MGKDNIGSLIRTATKNIHEEQPLTDAERAIVSNLAIPMKEARRNWYPIFVRETGELQFQLIGSSLILEAAKLAGLEVVYCIQIDESAETEKEIIDTQKLIQCTGSSSTTAVDLSPLLRRIDTMESTVNHHSTALNDVFKYLSRLMPEEKLAINKDDEKLLRAKLEGRISQVGQGKIDKFIGDIIKNRPFHSDEELRYGVNILKPKKSKSASPVYERTWKSLVEQFDIDYSV
jgi:hypothetical protein